MAQLVVGQLRLQLLDIVHLLGTRPDDGELAWRFRAAPIDERLMAFEQLESVWPVHGSVLVQDGVVYCVAGRSMFLDGGLRLLRLDPSDGRLLSETVLDDSDPVAKHYNMFKRRAEKGQYFHHPYLGTREFPCDFEWIDGPIPESELSGECDLGFMLHDIDFSPTDGKEFDTIDSHSGAKLRALPRFFRPTMMNGIIDVPDLRSQEVLQ